jgi:hypothetical protein
MKKPIIEQIVPHPRGGYTLAVPAGGNSTVRIYRGWWAQRPRKNSTRRAAA